MNGQGGNSNLPGGGFPLAGQLQPQGLVQQPAQWFDERMLRQICSQGAGAYRIRMTVANPPQGFQQGFPMQGHPYRPQYNQRAFGFPMAPYMLQGMPQGMNMSLGQPGQGFMGYPVMQVDEASNPNLGAVTMMQATKTNDDVTEKKKSGRKRKRNDGPKPARYAWNFFFKERYQKIRNGGGSGLFDVQEAFTKIGLKLGNVWKGLSAEERQPYLDMAAKDKARYEREMKKYKLGLPFKDVEQEKEEKNAPEDEGKSVDEKAEKDAETKEEKKEDKTPDISEITADILVTDDDETFMVMMEATLRRLNKKFQGVPKINIHKAKNGEEAIKKVVEEQRKYACITVDKEMGPGKDGFETVKQIRDSGYKGTVLGVTGNEGNEDGFGKMGADTTLMKGSQQLFNQIYSFVVEKINPDKKDEIDDTMKGKREKKESSLPEKATPKPEEKQVEQVVAN